MLWMLAGTAAWAGGGPLNVAVLYNAEVPDAADVAAYYAAQRELPEGHLCGVTGVGEAETSITYESYELTVLADLESCLSALPEGDRVDYLVVVRGLPYRVEAGSYTTSLSAMLQVYRSSVSGQAVTSSDGATVANPWYQSSSTSGYTVDNDYAGWYTSATAIVRAPEQPETFQRGGEGSGAMSGDLFVVTRLDGFDYADAYDLVDRAVASDGTFPIAPMLCMHGADSARGARDPECEYVTRMLAGLSTESLWLDTFDGALEGYEVSAYFTGAANMIGAIDGLTYAPGAITDNLTSYGAVPNNFFCSEDGETCPSSESQTSVARFVRAGATGAHGTVNEPYNNVFPNAAALLHYAMGYNLGESYFFNQRFLYWQNLTLGDPLATPYAERPVVSLSAEAPAENRPLTLSATHPDGVRAVRLFVDGALVAEDEGDTLEWVPGEAGFAEGDVLTAYAIAEADDVELGELPDWPHRGTVVRARTQGWSAVSLTIGPPEADPAPDDSGGGGKDEEGGCATVSGRAAGGLWWLVGLAAAVLRARERGGRSRPGAARTAP